MIDGAVVAEGELPEGVGMSGIQIGGGGLRVGDDAGFPVSDDYRPPFPWTGTLHELVVRRRRAVAPPDRRRDRGGPPPGVKPSRLVVSIYYVIYS